MVVVDASAVLMLLLDPAAHPELQQRLFDTAGSMHAPASLDLEIADALRRYEQSTEIQEYRAMEAMRDLADFPIRRYAQDWMLSRIWELKSTVATYDAAYLALAEALAAPLITADEKLANTEGHTVEIELFN